MQKLHALACISSLLHELQNFYGISLYFIVAKRQNGDCRKACISEKKGRIHFQRTLWSDNWTASSDHLCMPSKLHSSTHPLHSSSPLQFLPESSASTLNMAEPTMVPIPVPEAKAQAQIPCIPSFRITWHGCETQTGMSHMAKSVLCHLF